MLALTTEANAEVRRNLLMVFGIALGCFLAFTALGTAPCSPGY